MEFPDDVLRHIQEYARPRVSREARAEYARVAEYYGAWPMLKRKMVTPFAIAVVREHNDVADRIEELQTWYNEISLLNVRSRQIYRLLEEHYDLLRECNERIRALLQN
jgi:hypothetical protein